MWKMYVNEVWGFCFRVYKSSMWKDPAKDFTAETPADPSRQQHGERRRLIEKVELPLARGLGYQGALPWLGAETLSGTQFGFNTGLAMFHNVDYTFLGFTLDCLFPFLRISPFWIHLDWLYPLLSPRGLGKHQSGWAARPFPKKRRMTDSKFSCKKSLIWDTVIDTVMVNHRFVLALFLQ